MKGNSNKKVFAGVTADEVENMSKSSKMFKATSRFFFCRECHSNDAKKVCKTCFLCKEHGCTCTICGTCKQRFVPRTLGVNGCTYCRVKNRINEGEVNEWGERRKVNNFLGLYYQTRDNAGERWKKIVDPAKNRLLGAEIEVSRIEDFMEPRSQKDFIELASKWAVEIKSDGSLRNYQKSAEITTSPAGGKIWRQQVFDVYRALYRANASWGSDAGLHIHVDYSDFEKAREFYNMVLLIAIVEPYMQNLVEPRRLNNVNCPSITPAFNVNTMRMSGDREDNCRRHEVAAEWLHRMYEKMGDFPVTSDSSSRLFQLLSYYDNKGHSVYFRSWIHTNRMEPSSSWCTHSLPSLRDIIENDNAAIERLESQHGLNWHDYSIPTSSVPMRDYMPKNKTIEVRLHEGTSRADKVVNWGSSWAKIVDYAKEYADSGDLIGKFLRTYTTPALDTKKEFAKEMLQNIFPRRSNLRTYLAI